MLPTLLIRYECSHDLRVEFKMITNVLLQLVKGFFEIFSPVGEGIVTKPSLS